MANAFIPSTWEAGAGGSLSLRPGWPPEQVQVHLGLQRETLSPKKVNVVELVYYLAKGPTPGKAD